MFRFTTIAGLGLLAGCAATYQPPKIAAQDQSVTVSASKALILETAKRVLVAEGWQIAHADDKTGVVSTAARDYRVTPEQADCGSRRGRDYLRDDNTSSRVALDVIARDDLMTARADIDANYRAKPGEENQVLQCVSRGALEKYILDKIAGDRAY